MPRPDEDDGRGAPRRGGTGGRPAKRGGPPSSSSGASGGRRGGSPPAKGRASGGGGGSGSTGRPKPFSAGDRAGGPRSGGGGKPPSAGGGRSRDSSPPRRSSGATGGRPYEGRGGDARKPGGGSGRPYASRGGDDSRGGGRPYASRGGDDSRGGGRPYASRGGDDSRGDGRPYASRGGDARKPGGGSARPYAGQGDNARRTGGGSGRPYAARGGDDSRGGGRPYAGRGEDAGKSGSASGRPYAGRGRDGSAPPRASGAGSGRPYASRSRDDSPPRRAAGSSTGGGARKPFDRDRRDAPRAGDRGRQPARRQEREPRPEDRAPKTWGSLARKSLRELEPDQPGEARRVWRDAVARARGDDEEPWQPERWVEDDPAPSRPPKQRSKRATTAGTDAAAGAPATRPRPPRRLPPDVRSEVAGSAPATQADRYQDRLGEAARAYERDRYKDALRILKPLADHMPGASAVRELHGLTLYRLGRWNEAIRELEAYRALEPMSFDQHPTLADSYRAKKRWAQVAELWNELREASPTAELVAEGRLVMAGAFADQGKLEDAIALLEKARTDSRRPRSHHVRIWYALADLYERAGEIPRARELFRRVFDAAPELYDTSDRLRSIG